MQQEKKVGVVHSSDNKVILCIEALLNQNNGRLQIEVLEQKLQKRFHCVPIGFYTEAQIGDMNLEPEIRSQLSNGTYMLESGIVYKK